MSGPVVDVFTSVPTPARNAMEIRSWGNDPGYREMFAQRWSRQLGLRAEVITEVAELPAEGFLERGAALLEPHLPPLEDTVALLRRAGIERAVVHAPLPVDVHYPNDDTARIVAAAPDLFIGFVRVDPSVGEESALEIERGVRELGLRGVTITPFWHGLSCDDPVARPVFEAASGLGVPVWIHTSMNWVKHRPLDLEHPSHIDRLAGQFPDLRIICGHGGWPWVQDLVAVAWRHRHVYVDVSAFRPRNVFQAGAGWEALVYHGARTIRDRLLFGSTWSLLGRSPEEMVEEAWNVPWPAEVRQAWLHDNGRRLLDADGTDRPT